MNGQLSLLDQPVDEPPTIDAPRRTPAEYREALQRDGCYRNYTGPLFPPLPDQPRVNGRLQFSDTPHDFKRELAAIVADEQRLHAEQRNAS